MSDSAYPAHHPVQQVDTAHGYITEAVAKLQSRGIGVDRSHLDPMGPVDATIILGENALVWDEWAGWRIGTFVSGRQGERTVLRTRAASAAGSCCPRSTSPPWSKAVRPSL